MATLLAAIVAIAMDMDGLKMKISWGKVVLVVRSARGGTPYQKMARTVATAAEVEYQQTKVINNGSRRSTTGREAFMVVPFRWLEIRRR